MASLIVPDLIENEELRLRPPIGRIADLRALECFSAFGLQTSDHGRRARVIGSTTLPTRLIVGTAQNGSRQAVVESGTISKSLSLIAFQPRIDEPSTTRP